MWHIYKMEHYPTIKRNETGSFVEIWVDLDSIMQSELSQKEINIYSRIYVDSRKMYEWTYLQGRNRDTSVKQDM